MIINKKLLSQYSPLPINYDYSEIMNYVPVAEEIWIRPLIGEDLYDEIDKQVSENKISEEIQALMTDGKLLQYLSYATCLEGLPFLWTNISTVGITLGKSDNSDSVTLKDLIYVENHLRRQVEFLKDSVKRYICERPEYYPLADFCACGCSACCNDDSELNNPNKWKQIWSTPKKNTDLR